MPGATACANHPAREAMGVCVRCHTLVCAECVTQVDGVNHCVSCLAAVAAARAPAARPAPAAARGGWTDLLVAGAALALALWGILEATLPG